MVNVNYDWLIGPDISYFVDKLNVEDIKIY